MNLVELRQAYHKQICTEIIRINREKGYPNFADGSNKTSVRLAWAIIEQMGYETNYSILKEQTIGGRFEQITKVYLEESFTLLQHLRPGKWHYSTERTSISSFTQYEHLAYLEQIVTRDMILSSAIKGDYIVKPDIIIARQPVPDTEINAFDIIINKSNNLANLTPLRAENCSVVHPILHASISCKWTIRSDRSQNTRTEALNLIRHRKGHLPHIVAVTAEPLPTRISSLAMGTGDLDCVYHFALTELESAIREIANDDQLDMLQMMVDGRRLRDISDLPFDLAA
jgi:hypothetical protein